MRAIFNYDERGSRQDMRDDKYQNLTRIGKFWSLQENKLSI
uniref:Uncharacterized protein n=1 Tax=Cucumis melo TaxID=3656 RepID=A0A9I9EDW4_CUCME